MLGFAVAAIVSAFLPPQTAAGSQFLRGHVPEAVARLRLQPVGFLPATNRLHLAIGLPLRNREELSNLLEQLYDPTSTNYHHYLTPQQFTERFGPTEQDYQAVINFDKTNGLTVTGTYLNRTLVDVDAPVADVERTFHVKMHVYQHPTENRTFYAPDREPNVDFNISLLHISGLNNYVIPHPASLRLIPSAQTPTEASANSTGSGPSGSYKGNDFSRAYVPGVVLDGSGQEVGLFEFYGYYTNDITTYEFVAGLPNVPLSNIFVGTNIILGINCLNGNPDPVTGDDSEAALDIEMVISIAPKLSKVVVYEGYDRSGNNANDVLNTMANDTNNTIKQFSCSWFFDSDSNTEQSLQQFIAQGQSFFQASGDDGAYSGPIVFSGAKSGAPADDPYLTSVGGTILTTTGLPSESWVSETTWSGSGGGISTTYSITNASWQQGIDMAINLGSTTMRNIPDVAMVADNIFLAANYTTYTNSGGTSAAAPLWAGFTALVNQQLALNGQTNTVGFLNPALYRIGKRPSLLFGPPFHDISDYSNNGNANQVFYAVPGYDLCTGWGTPNGTNLINALVAMPPVITNQPQSENVTIGSVATFNVGVSGTPPFSYQWFWNDSAHPLHDGGNISGSLTGVLTISNVQSTNAGTYYVVISNPANSLTSSSAVLTVFTAVSTITFDNLPNSTGGSSVPNGYQGLNWGNFYYLNGLTNIYNPSGYAVGVMSPNNVVFNAGGNAATITRSSLPFDFVSAYLTAAWNDNLQLKVLGYTGSTITYSNMYTLSATNPTFITFNYLGITEVYFASSGGTPHTNYTSASKHQFVMDNVSITTNLTVAAPPQIVIQPTNRAASAGAKVIFTVSAFGTAPLGYQWRKDGGALSDGGNIFGATTSDLTVSNISTADVAVYSVVVSNPYGSEISTGAVLAVYVLAPPSLITFDELATPEIDTNNGVFFGDEGAIPTNYFNLSWNNFRVLDDIGGTPSGFQAGAVSLNNVAFNVQANPASITSAAPFNFVSAYLTAAWNDNLQVKVLGYAGSTVTYSNVYTLSATAPTLINFNYLGVNEVYFASSGGTHHSSYVGSGPHFAMDSVTIATNLAVNVLPTVQTMTQTGGTITLRWGAIVGQTYQVQYKTNLTEFGWDNLGAPIIATASTIYVPDSTTNSQRFYRIVLLP